MQKGWYVVKMISCSELNIQTGLRQNHYCWEGSILFACITQPFQKIFVCFFLIPSHWVMEVLNTDGYAITTAGMKYMKAKISNSIFCQKIDTWVHAKQAWNRGGLCSENNFGKYLLITKQSYIFGGCSKDAPRHHHGCCVRATVLADSLKVAR